MPQAWAADLHQPLPVATDIDVYVPLAVASCWGVHTAGSRQAGRPRGALPREDVWRRDALLVATLPTGVQPPQLRQCRELPACSSSHQQILCRTSSAVTELFVTWLLRPLPQTQENLL